MLLADHKQQLSSDPLGCKSRKLTAGIVPTDELSEIMANMTKTLHMNTPEHTLSGLDIDIHDDDDDDDNYENRESHQEQLIEQLQAQLIHNQIQRTQVRDYARILNQSSTPARWYKVPPISRSVYFYDPNYQKYVQQQSISSQRTKPQIRPIPPQLIRIQERPVNQSNLTQQNIFPLTPRTKYMLDLYNTAVSYHHQKQRSNHNYHPTTPNIPQISITNSPISSRLQLVVPLPSIMTSKQQNDKLSNLFILKEQNYELRKKI